jgi:hypothetical protein
MASQAAQNRPLKLTDIRAETADHGDAEIQELHLAVRPHEDVRRLKVAVQNQVCVRLGHGGENIQKELQAAGHAE